MKTSNIFVRHKIVTFHWIAYSALDVFEDKTKQGQQFFFSEESERFDDSKTGYCQKLLLYLYLKYRTNGFRVRPNCQTNWLSLSLSIEKSHWYQGSANISKEWWHINVQEQSKVKSGLPWNWYEEKVKEWWIENHMRTKRVRQQKVAKSQHYAALSFFFLSSRHAHSLQQSTFCSLPKTGVFTVSRIKQTSK